MSLRIIPALHKGAQAQVHAFIALHHRHHKAPAGEVFRLACADETGAVRGVLTMGRPVSRAFDDGWTMEVTRVATDGARNACSLLYGSARRIAWSMGCRRIYTYNLSEEGGASLRAAGWTEDGPAGGGEWSRESRHRKPADRPVRKIRWSCVNPRAHQGDVLWPEAEVESLPLFGGGAV